MKKVRNILWGVVLVAIGVIVGLNEMEIVDFDIFFDGWWTFLIIIPSFIGVFTEGPKTFNVAGVCFGAFLLLCCRDILEFSMIWKLGVPVLVVVVGLKMIFGGLFKNKSEKIVQNNVQNGISVPKYNALFSSSDVNFSGEMFYGAGLNAVFGGVTCDLRNAFVEQDCVVKAVAVFGGVDIYAPEGVNIKVHSTSLFGGVSNEKHKSLPENPNTIFVNAICLFGGVDIK